MDRAKKVGDGSVLNNQECLLHFRTRNLWPLLLLTLSVVVYFHPLLNNKITPGGDGSRIFPYLEFVNNSEKFYPLWNPYKVGGVPTLAEPERYIWLGNLINTQSDYANLYLNFTFIGVVIFITWTIYFLGRELEISKGGAVIAGVVFGLSGYCSHWVHHGRLNSLVVYLVTNIALLFFIKYFRRRRLYYLILVAFLTGWVISTDGYYAIITYFTILVTASWYYNKLQHNNKKVLKNITKELLFIGIIGVLLFAVFLFPMTDYLWSNYTTLNPKSSFSQSLPRIVSFTNVFLPAYELGSWSTLPFISLVSLPLLVFCFLNFKAINTKPVLIFVILSIFSLIFLMGRIYPFRFIALVYEEIPVLRQIRAPSAFFYLLTYSMAFLCGSGFDLVRGHAASGKYRSIIPLLLVAVFVVLTLLGDVIGWYFGDRVSSFRGFLDGSYVFGTKSIETWKLLTIICLLCFPYTGIKNKSAVRGYIVLLICLQIVFVGFSLDEKKVKNKPVLTRMARVLNGDKSYYRIWGDGNWNVQSVGMPTVRALNGFSLFFSKEHRWQLENIFGKKLVELRPHWAKRDTFQNWDMKMIELSNVKYVMSRHEDKLPKEKWDLVALERKGKLGLWRKNKWNPAIRLIDNWQVFTNEEEVLKKMKTADYSPFSQIYLEKDPHIMLDENEKQCVYDISIISFAADEVIVEIISNKNGILFFPEYHDDGWKASVDNRPASVIRANASFIGLAIKKGRHRVRIYYSPSLVYASLIISSLCLFFCIIFITYYTKIKK